MSSRASVRRCVFLSFVVLGCTQPLGATRPLVTSDDDVVARVHADGAHLTLGAHRVHMQLWALGRGALAPMASGAPAGTPARAAIDHGEGIVEWWEPRAVGIEHGVTIATRPSGSGPLELAIAVDSDTVASWVSPDDVALTTASGEPVGHYRQLVVVDAEDARVPARMAVVDGRIHLHIQDGEARYPLVIDPLIVAQEAALTLAEPENQDNFGSAVAFSDDGTVLLAGASGDGIGGSARVYVRGPGGWTEQATLTPAGVQPDDGAGYAVALSADGRTALVGVPSEYAGPIFRSGSVRVFERGSGSTWTERAALRVTDPGNDDFFGSALALSADGSTAAIGVPGDQIPEGGGIFGPSSQGSVRIFRRSGSAWVEEAMLAEDTMTAGGGDNFGNAVAMSADGARVLVGVRYDDGPRADGGSARVYVRAPAGTWSLEATLTIPMGQSGDFDQMGDAVAMSADGTRAVVGAPGDNRPSLADAGSAWVFLRTGTSWALEATLSDDRAEAWFGRSVAITDDGTRILAGAPSRFVPPPDPGPVGTAALFVRGPGGWVRDATLLPPDAEAGDAWGWDVALDATGSRAVLGSIDDPGVDGDGNDVYRAGSVRVFTLEPQRANGATCSAASQCLSGECVDGVCCDTACGGGAANDCMACSVARGAGRDGTCGPLGPVAAPSVTCRAAVGTCDDAEQCVSGSISCPADVGIADTTVVCRTATGVCDVAERCDGTPVCPIDGRAMAGTICNASLGSCDVPEVCDGVAVNCPGDVLAPSGTACGMGVGDCGTPANCTGASPFCPSSGVRPAGHVCRPVGGDCDVEEICDGVSSLCPTDAKVASGTTCGASSGEPCDTDDTCDGVQNGCVDAFLSAVVCRASTGACDPEEVCSGSAATCPADGIAPAETVCRASTDLSCDPLESCDGTSAACPADEGMCTDPDGGAGGATDGGSSGDAGTPPAAAGCACTTAGARGSHGSLTLFTLLALGIARALRRAQRHSPGRSSAR